MFPVLSFAIPTYNFGEFIAETVHSIYAGLPKDQPDLQIEVLIVDGNSTDKTQEIVLGLSEIYPGIRYEKMPKRGGIDFDLNYAVSRCTAPYVWFFSADDLLAPNWFDAVWPRLSQHQPDITLIPAVLCNFDMSPRRQNRIFDVPNDALPRVFEIQHSDDLRTYLHHALTLEVLFSYMSGVLVKRAVWDRLPDRLDYFGSCWAHCAKLIQLFAPHITASRIMYLNKFVLHKRSGNDSFMEHGLIRRIGITVEGWTRIIDEFFGKTKHATKILELLRADFSVLILLYAKFSCQNVHDRDAVIKLARKMYLSSDTSFLSRLKFSMVFCMPSLPRLQRCTKNLLPILNALRHKIYKATH
jgi:abequosyltransferase